jgi:hypothetical protein
VQDRFLQPAPTRFRPRLERSDNLGVPVRLRVYLGQSRQNRAEHLLKGKLRVVEHGVDEHRRHAGVESTAAISGFSCVFNRDLPDREP